MQQNAYLWTSMPSFSRFYRVTIMGNESSILAECVIDESPILSCDGWTLHHAQKEDDHTQLSVFISKRGQGDGLLEDLGAVSVSQFGIFTVSVSQFCIFSFSCTILYYFGAKVFLNLFVNLFLRDYS